MPINTAEAFRENLFENPQNNSRESASNKGFQPYGQEIAAMTAKIKGSNVTVAFASMHNWGFKIYKRGTKPPKGEDASDKSYAKTYTQETLDLMKTQKSDFAFIGGDLNNN